jgi:hypothetical protein
MNDIPDNFEVHTAADRLQLERLRVVQRRRDEGEDSDSVPEDIQSDVATALNSFMRTQELFQQAMKSIQGCVRNARKAEELNRHDDVIWHINRLHDLVARASDIAELLKTEAERT